MTGNTKVWRAPLAGLASLAMIATMGVAAGTASAAERSVTLNAGTGATYSDGTSSYTLKDNDSTAKFEQLYANLPTRSGYTFTGWYAKDSKTAVSPTDENLNGQTLTAHWTVDGKVMFTPAGAAFTKGDGITPTVEYVNNSGNKQSLPANGSYEVPVASGDVLADWQVPTDTDPADGDQYEWYTTAQGGAKADVKNLKAGSTVYLQVTQLAGHKVSFNATTASKDDFAGSTDPVRVADGAKQSTVAFPEGYYFTTGGSQKKLAAWNASPAYDESKGIKADTEYTAATGTTVAHLVTFENYDGKGNAKTLVVKDGTTINSVKRFSAPKSNDDAKFDGFYTVDASGNVTKAKADLDSVIKADVTLHAKWTPVAQDVTVSFDPYYDNAPAPETQKVKSDGWVSQPKTPTRAGYVFKGWKYTKSDGRTTVEVKKADLDDFFPVKVTELKVADNKASFLATWTETDKSAYADAKGAVDLTRDQNEYTRQSWIEYTDAYNDITDGDGEQSDGSFNGSDFDYDQATKDLKAAQKKLVQKADTKMYVLYNKNNSDHLYTTSLDEYNGLGKLGWNAQGVSFKVTLNKAPYSAAIYRVYNPNSGEHLFLQKGEAANAVAHGWTYDEPSTDQTPSDLPTGWKDGDPIPFFYTPQNATTTLNRLFNPNARDAGSHYYTANAGETKILVGFGWKLESASALKVAAK
ncbi:InlB B-repeat-containing protein [Bifidobacterium goeldii]|nr:InlB B-repeat-containing protein [Bifidobacterium goeldii]